MEWNTLRSNVQGLNLNDLIKDDFIKRLNDEFKDKEVDVINLQITIRDKLEEPSGDANLEVISLFNKNIEDTLLNNVIVDVTKTENFNKVKNVLEDL